MNHSQMKAIGFYQALPIDHPDALLDLRLPIPEPGPHDLLVRVEAISVNPADYRMRSRKADDGQLAVAGWDVAGVVAAIGSAVNHPSIQFSLGDKVYYAGDLMRSGGNSEYHLVDARIVGYCPTTLTATQAASVPLTALTAWEAIFERLRLSMTAPNRLRTLLIIGGAGGVGSMAIQLAKLIPDLQVIATASSAESQAWCRQLGADKIINHYGDMKLQLAEHGFDSVDAILIANDPDKHFQVLADLISPQGSICSIVPFDNPPDMNRLMRKSVNFVWEFMFTRAMFQTKDMLIQRDILNQIATLIDSNRIVSTATKDLGLINAANLRTAHAELATGRTIGKLTLTAF